MPATLNTYINNTLTRYNSWFSLVDDIYNALYTAGAALKADGHNAAGDALNSAASNMQTQSQYTLSWDGTSQYWIIRALQWINTNWPAGGGAIVMGDILTAMLTATHKQIEHFIGIEEAYKIALWNAPFNAEFYAALGRGFSQWPEP